MYVDITKIICVFQLIFCIVRDYANSMPELSHNLFLLDHGPCSGSAIWVLYVTVCKNMLSKRLQFVVYLSLPSSQHLLSPLIFSLCPLLLPLPLFCSSPRLPFPPFCSSLICFPLCSPSWPNLSYIPFPPVFFVVRVTASLVETRPPFSVVPRLPSTHPDLPSASRLLA